MELIKNNSSLSIVNLDLAKQVYQINQLVPYPLSDVQIEDIARSLDRLVPELTPELLGLMMDRFKYGYYQWDRTQLIQNIFNNLGSILSEKYKDQVELHEITNRFRKTRMVL